MSYTKEETVYIRRKASNSAFGNDIEKKFNIGGSVKGQDVLRGLTADEEKIYLPAIIGSQPNDMSWEKAKKEYWASISAAVPEGDGRKLDVSMIYDNESLANQDPNNLKGYPRNVNDYILWRYCLVYSRVAANIEKADASPKIKFYLFNERQDRAIRKNNIDLKVKATQAFLEVRNDVEKVKNLLLVYSKDDATIKPLSEIPVDDYDIILDRLVLENPTKFLANVGDNQLAYKAFIQRCITRGLLRRIPNTDTIMTDDNITLGNTTDETIAYLGSEKGNGKKEELKAKLRQG